MAGLSSVSQPLSDVAHTCIRLITDLVNTPARSRANDQVLLSPDLVVRSTSLRRNATDVDPTRVVAGLTPNPDPGGTR